MEWLTVDGSRPIETLEPSGMILDPQLVDSPLLLDAVLRNVEDAVMVEDETGVVRCINQRFCDLFGLELPSELEDGDAGELSATVAGQIIDGGGFMIGVAELVGSAEGVSGERFRLRDGRTVERDYVPISLDGRPYCHLWLYRDLSYRLDLAPPRLRAA